MDAEEQRPSKRQPGGVDLVCPMSSVTPTMTNRAKEHADKLTAEKKKKAAQYIAERDEKLKAIGQEDCAKFYVDKLAEVKTIVGEVEKEAVKEAQEILKKVQGTPEAGASGSILESAASETERSEALLSAKVTQIPDSPSTSHHHTQLIMTKTTYLSVKNSTYLTPLLNLNHLR